MTMQVTECQTGGWSSHFNRETECRAHEDEDEDEDQQLTLTVIKARFPSEVLIEMFFDVQP